MAMCLNTPTAYVLYKELLNSAYFVDKSAFIELINNRIQTNTKFICITKPRRFGKTSILNMLGAFYCKAYDTKALFDNLKISSSKSYKEHLNQYNVINLSLNNLPDQRESYADYIGLILTSIRNDIIEEYPELKNKSFANIADLLAATRDQFIFIIDEWDYIFSHELFPEHHNDFLEFLRNLLKDRPYVALAYMTGVLPIKKYSTGSALNMFDEYTMLNDHFFEEYFGFMEYEVEALCSKQNKVPLETIRDWYNGYQTTAETKVYNPRSVVLALLNGYCQSYWTRTGRMDEVLFFLKHNIGEVREDVVKMINDTSVIIDIEQEYSAGQEAPRNREEIYSAMIIYGLLSYHDGELRIPNKELMLEFQKALKDDDFGYVAELVRNSAAVLTATLEQKSDIVASYLHNIHNSELPILKYNDENSLSCVVTLAYLSARNKYRIEREEKSGKGFADFIFHPKRQNLPGIILELKANSTPQEAIAQIKEKEYTQKLRNEKVQTILAVGLSYNTTERVHQCIIEELSISKS